LGTGIYLPKNIVTAEEIDRRAELAPGWTKTHSGVLARRFVGGETASYMGAQAVKDALANAGLSLADVDCLVCTSGTMQQPIPCTAALIKEQLGATGDFPAFDMNATCLSFLAGLDTMSYLVAAGRYQCVVLVASEIASRGLNWSDAETCSILGDGASAIVMRRSDEAESSQLITARIETFPIGAHHAEIKGGGSGLPAGQHNIANQSNYLFHMNGRALFRLASDVLPGFVRRLLSPENLGWPDFKLVIPHQASVSALRLTRKRLGIPIEKFYSHAAQVGNTIAASIPMGLHFALNENRLQRGDKCLLIGTSAGFSVGGVALVF
jgi:3-oxoacyl-[acyl-carrier-protein] synthase-3